jgi:hypothetical protein
MEPGPTHCRIGSGPGAGHAGDIALGLPASLPRERWKGRRRRCHGIEELRFTVPAGHWRKVRCRREHLALLEGGYQR